MRLSEPKSAWDLIDQLIPCVDQSQLPRHRLLRRIGRTPYKIPTTEEIMFPCKYFAVWCLFMSYMNALEWVY